MTQAAAINQANPYGPTNQELFAGEVLSGEALMFYISSRLNDLDGTISELMGMQQDALARKQFLQEVEAWARDGQQFHDDYSGDYSDYGTANDGQQAEFPWPPEGHPHRELAEQAWGDYQESIKDIHLNRDEREFAYEEYITRIGQMIEQVDGQSELNMIRLQQVMAQRQMAIQLTTNLLAKYNSGQEAIVGNLR